MDSTPGFVPDAWVLSEVVECVQEAKMRKITARNTATWVFLKKIEIAPIGPKTLDMLKVLYPHKRKNPFMKAKRPTTPRPILAYHRRERLSMTAIEDRTMLI